jgi:hypothetical protein
MNRRSFRTRLALAMVTVCSIGLGSGLSFAGPAAEQPDAGADPETVDPADPADPADETSSDVGPETASAPVSKQRLEQAMASIGRIAADAKARGDAVRAACVLDKQERGQAVMEVATGELLVIGDSSSTPRQRGFAAEKLHAAADRLDGLAEQASLCGGDQTPEDADDVTRNEVDEAQTVPVADPTRDGAGGSPVPPPVDDHQPVSVASPSA